MFKKITAAVLCGTILGSSAFAATPAKVNADLFPTSNSRIYVAQGLLHDDKSWDVAYEVLRDIIKNDKTINKVSKKKVKKAARLIRNYNLYSPLRGITTYGQYKVRPYVEAQLYLAEALMDSRVFLNQSFDTEVVFVEQLLKNYFFPLQSENVKISYPAESAYAFNRWAVTKENLTNRKTEQAVDNSWLGGIGKDEIDVTDPVKSNKGNEKGSDKVTEGKAKEGDKAPTYVNRKVEGEQSGPTGSDKGIVEDAIEVVDIAVEAADKFSQITDTFKENEEKSNRVQNRYLGQSMLLQAIAEPGSALVDPQLQEFLKGVRIEYSLGEMEMPEALELEAINESLGENIVKGDDKKLSIDMSKLYQMNRAGTYSSLKLEFRSIPGKAGRATLFVISSVSGEDLMFNRVVQYAAHLAQNFDAITSSKAATATATTLGKVPGFLAHLGAALQGTIKYGDAANKLSMYSSAWNSSKKLLAWTLTKAQAPQKLMTKVAASPTMQKVLDKTVRTKFVQSGALFKTLIGLGVAIEVTTGLIEMSKAETKEEKADARDEMLARTGAQFVYLVPYAGVAAMTVDFLHYTAGLPFETADIFRGAATLGECAGLWMAGYNRTTFRLLELENKYRLPRHEVYIRKLGVELDTIEKAVEAKQAVYNEVQDIALKNLILIYRAHRGLPSDRSNYDFGERLADYMEHFETDNIEVAKETLLQIDDQIELLRSEDKVQSEVEAEFGR